MTKSIFKKINYSDFYILGWLIVLLITSSQPTPISGKLMIILTLWSFYFFVKVLLDKRSNKLIKSLNLLLLMFTAYGILHILFGPVLYVQATDIVVSQNNYIKGIYASLLPIYAFYYFAQKGLISQEKIRYWSLLFIIIAVVQYYNIYMNTAMAFMRQESFTNNAGYIVVALFPLVALWNNKQIVKFAMAILIVILAVLSAKRGAMLIAILCVLYTFRSALKSGSKSGKWKIVSLIFLVSIVLFSFVKEQFSSNDYLMMRLENTLAGDTNGRDELSSIFWSHYANEYNIIQQIFGGGAENTINISDNYAHNDWIEILINNGIIGFLIYLSFWFTMVKTWWRSKHNKFVCEALGLYIIIYLPMTLFSMSYTGVQIYSSVMLGLVINELITSQSI